MEHPNAKCREAQKRFLEQCPQEEREFHERLFRFGNAVYIYHGLGNEVPEKDLKIYYKEWLEGLPDNIKSVMERQGFEQCKNALPFLRYVNERTDIGMDDWMREHLSKEDYEYYISQKSE